MKRFGGLIEIHCTYADKARTIMLRVCKTFPPSKGYTCRVLSLCYIKFEYTLLIISSTTNLFHTDSTMTNQLKYVHSYLSHRHLLHTYVCMYRLGYSTSIITMIVLKELVHRVCQPGGSLTSWKSVG